MQTHHPHNVTTAIGELFRSNYGITVDYELISLKIWKKPITSFIVPQLVQLCILDIMTWLHLAETEIHLYTSYYPTDLFLSIFSAIY